MPFKRNRTSRLRFIRAYLLIILAFTLLLFCFSLISLSSLKNDQRQKVKELSSTNIKYSWTEKAPDFARRMGILAADCLREQNIKRLAYLPGKENSLQDLRAFRDYFNTLRDTHPIAQHFFIFSGNQLVFPRISFPPHQSLKSIALELQPQSNSMFSRLLREDDQGEMQLGNPAEAAQVYRSVESMQVGPRLKAIALSRKARALEKAHLGTEAVEAYQTLLNLYGDQYDESQTPFVLKLAAAPEETAEKLIPSGSQSLQKIYRDLTNGKWELSSEQTEYYMTRLEQRLKLSAASRGHSDFLDHFQAAKAVRQQLLFTQHPPPFVVAPQSFVYGNETYQTYRVSMPGEGGQEVVVAFSVSIPWINSTLLPAYHRQFIGEIGTPALVADQEQGSGKDIEVPFGEALTLWKIRIPAESMGENGTATSREFWFVGISTFMFLCVLGLGLSLFIRVSFHIRWDRLRSDFVSGVSHEFKTPLSLIRLYSETLSNNDEDYSPEDRRNYIRIIARESERMSRLIDNVLDFSKMEQGRKLSEMLEGDLGPAVAQAVNDYSDYLTWRGFSVKSSIWPQLPPVRFNREQVAQMVLNLLDNARKYSGLSRRIRVNVWAQESEVVVEVQDNGPGIPAEEIEKIFQPFYRIAKGGEKGGCGLGLYLVDQVMKEHHGRVEVESTLNQGSSFRLVFPVSGAHQAASGKRDEHAYTRAQSEPQVQDFS